MEPTTKKEQFIEFRAKGWSFDKIAKKLKKSKPTLIAWSRELQEEIANFKALELEALYEKYFLLKQSRIKFFGDTLKKIKRELDTRNLKNIPTDKLLDVFIKYYSLLKEEYVELHFKTDPEIIEEKQERELLDELTASSRGNNKEKLVKF